MPPAIALVDPVVPALNAHRDEFASVDRIPVGGVSFQVIPWLLLLGGVVSIGVGVAGVVRPSRLTALAVAGVGGASVVIALACGLPGRFHDVHEIMPVGRAALSQRAADTATRTIQVVGAMVDEVEGPMLTDVAGRLGVSREALDAQVARSYPDVAAGLREWPRIERSGADLARRQEATVADLAEGDGLPFRTLPWLVIVPAALLTLIASAATVRSSPRAARYPAARAASA